MKDKLRELADEMEACWICASNGDGEITLETINNWAGRLAAILDAEGGSVSEAQIMTEWFKADGSVHGPNVETVTMPQAKYLAFRRSITHPHSPDAADSGRVTSVMVAQFKIAFHEHSTISPEYDGCIRAGLRAALSAQPADSGRVGDARQELLDELELVILAHVGMQAGDEGAPAMTIRVCRAAIAALAAQGQGEVACHRFLGPTGEVVTEWEDGLPDNGKRFPDLCPPVSSVQYAYFHTAPPASPAGRVIRTENGGCYIEWAAGADMLDYAGSSLYTAPPASTKNAEVPDGCIPIHRTLLDKLATDMDSIDMPKIGAAIRRWVANYDARQSAAPSAPEGDGGGE